MLMKLRLLFQLDELKKHSITELNEEIEKGLSDIEAGRISDGKTVLINLLKRYE